MRERFRHESTDLIALLASHLIKPTMETVCLGFEGW
jgi:hypothetical protein